MGFRGVDKYLDDEDLSEAPSFGSAYKEDIDLFESKKETIMSHIVGMEDNKFKLGKSFQKDLISVKKKNRVLETFVDTTSRFDSIHIEIKFKKGNFILRHSSNGMKSNGTPEKDNIQSFKSKKGIKKYLYKIMQTNKIYT